MLDWKALGVEPVSHHEVIEVFNKNNAREERYLRYHREFGSEAGLQMPARAGGRESLRCDWADSAWICSSTFRR